MKMEMVDNKLWPVAEQGDFDFSDGGESFPFIEDEDGSRYFGFGHIDKEKFTKGVERYIRHMSGESLLEAGEEMNLWVDHLHAKFTDDQAERFTWLNVGPETPGAWPITVGIW